MGKAVSLTVMLLSSYNNTKKQATSA